MYSEMRNFKFTSKAKEIYYWIKSDKVLTIFFQVHPCCWLSMACPLALETYTLNLETYTSFFFHGYITLTTRCGWSIDGWNRASSQEALCCTRVEAFKVVGETLRIAVGLEMSRT